MTTAVAKRKPAAAPIKQPITITLPTLADGERWAGILLGQDGQPDQHIILLPGQATEVTWQKAVAWAKEQKGELPTRREQRLLFANVQDAFEERAYWSGEEHARNGDYAWAQYFNNGDQDDWDKHDELRAVAVRRVVI